MKKRSKYLSQSSVLMHPYIPKWKLHITTMNNAKNLMILHSADLINKGKLNFVVSATDQIVCSKFIALVKVPPDLFNVTNPSMGSRIKSNNQPESVRPSVRQSVSQSVSKSTSLTGLPSIFVPLVNRKYLSTIQTMIPGECTPYNGLYGEAPPKRGTFLGLISDI